MYDQMGRSIYQIDASSMGQPGTCIYGYPLLSCSGTAEPAATVQVSHPPLRRQCTTSEYHFQPSIAHGTRTPGSACIAIANRCLKMSDERYSTLLANCHVDSRTLLSCCSIIVGPLLCIVLGSPFCQHAAGNMHIRWTFHSDNTEEFIGWVGCFIKSNLTTHACIRYTPPGSVSLCISHTHATC